MEPSRCPLMTKLGAPIPLREVDAEGELVGGVLTMRMRQRFENRERGAIEAIYTFPLPSDATVIGFWMESGGRRLEGQVFEREEAFRRYDDAMIAGHGAALVEQERRNVFTANVGNILPGEDVVIEIVYVERVTVDEGSLRVTVPTLVAPRYMPGAPAGPRTAFGTAEPTTRVPDADRISPSIGDASYAIGLRLDLHVDARARIVSPSHAIAVADLGSAKRVTFTHGRVRLDRDVVVNVEGDVEAAGMSAVAAHRRPSELDDHGGLRGLVRRATTDTPPSGYVALTHVPNLPRRKTDAVHVVFVVDTSGSMAGLAIEEARRALRLSLRQLRVGDAFTIIAFDDRFEALSPGLLAFDEANLRLADDFVARMHADGGTEMLEPLLEAVRLAPRGIVVLLTDGQVGNEDEIAQAVLQSAPRTRFYTFGIGTNVSDHLLGELARRSRGGKESIHPGERIDDKVLATFARATARRVTDVRLETSGVTLEEVAPGALPDLVDGEAFTILARYATPGEGTLTLRGSLDGAPWTCSLPVHLPEEADAPAVATLWARARIDALEAMPLEGRRERAMRERIVALAKEHGLASRHTSLLVVETRDVDRRATGAAARPIPVSAPHGWTHASPASCETLGAPMPAMSRPAPPTPAAPMRARAASFGAAPPPPARATPPLPARPPPPGATASSFDMVRPSKKESVRLEESAASGVDEVVELLASQNAAGFFGEGTGSGAVLRTVAVLHALVGRGIDSAHPRYGAQIKRAIEALLGSFTTQAMAPALCEPALAVAFLAASGARTRALVTRAVDAHAPTLRPRLADVPALHGLLASLPAP